MPWEGLRTWLGFMAAFVQYSPLLISEQRDSGGRRGLITGSYLTARIYRHGFPHL